MEKVDDFDQFCSWAMKPNEFIEHYQTRTTGSYEVLDSRENNNNKDETTNDDKNEDTFDETMLYRVRSFKKTHKGVVNQGDRVRACSFLSLNLPPRSKSFTKGEKPFKFQCVENQSLSSPEESTSTNITASYTKENSSINEKIKTQTIFEIFVIGKNGVGKTSLCEQFLTSDSCELYTNIGTPAFDNCIDSCGRNIQQVTVDLDGIEWTLIFHDYEDPQRTDNEKYPDAYIMVYSVDDNDSFDWCSKKAESISDSAIIIVGNKSDLERLRQVSIDKGKRLAEIYDGEFFEVSTILNHMVDNLLVQIILEIRRHIKILQKGKYPRSKYSLKHKKPSPGDMLLNFFRRLSKAF